MRYPSISNSEKRYAASPAFTLIELLMVIVVIAILAALSIVSYNGIQTRARNTVLQSDLRNAATQLGIDNATDGSYPSGSTVPTSLVASDTNSYQYTSDGTSYCLTITSSVPSAGTYHISSDEGSVQEGACVGHTAGGGSGGSAIADGSYIQDITSANCPTTRTRAVDARDNHTYWVQQLADGKCWMLTNLAYAGGGTNTYSDTKTLTNGTGGSTTYTTPSYYVVPSTTNYTTEPTAPSTSTDGTGQYGYLYNWCGAMGGQATAACDLAQTPTVDANISICPSGWRLPTGASEWTALNNGVNAGATNTDTGLRSAWLLQYSGRWVGNFDWTQGAEAYYHDASENIYSGSTTYGLNAGPSAVTNAATMYKSDAHAVRCLTD